MYLFIYGNGGLGKEIYDIVSRVNTKSKIYNKVFFINDFQFDNISIFSFDEIIKRGWHLKGYEIIIAVGEVSQRVRLLSLIKKHNFKLTTIIDPSAIVSPYAILEKGCVICPFVLIGPNSKIGENSVVNVQSIIGHDIQIGNNTIVSSMVNIGGNTIVGDECYLGMSSVVKEKRTLGNKCVLSMGSVLHIDLPEKVLAIGNPARIIRKVEDDFNVFK